MGLMGLFLNKTALKVLLLGAVAFLLLRFLTWFLSFAAELSWVPLAGLIAATLIASKSIAAKKSRPGVILGSETSLLFVFLTFILMLDILVPVQIPDPLSVPIKLVLASLPSLLYFAIRKTSWPKRRVSFFHGRLRHYKRTSPSDMLPKGMEEGHIVYNAGSRGFRVLKFIEVRQQFDGKEKSDSGQVRRQIAVTLTRQLNTMRKLGIEVSYELHCRGGVPRVYIASISEGRDYRTCRSVVDECSNLFSQSIRSFGSTTISTRSSEECNKAKKILTLPTFTNFEVITQIENADHNINLFRDRDDERPIRLRMIHLSSIRSPCLKSESGLIDELVDIALSHRPVLNFTCILHIKPLPEFSIDQELMETSKNHAAAITQVSEELKNKFLAEFGETRKPLNNGGDRISSAKQEAQNANLKIERLQKAKKSGYFEVNVTVISEPAAVESIARRIRLKTTEDGASTELSIDHVPPQLLVDTIRRHPLLLSDKLTGEEMVSLVQLPRSLLERRTKSLATEPTKLAITDSQILTMPNLTKR